MEIVDSTNQPNVNFLMHNVTFSKVTILMIEIIFSIPKSDNFHSGDIHQNKPE